MGSRHKGYPARQTQAEEETLTRGRIAIGERGMAIYIVAAIAFLWGYFLGRLDASVKQFSDAVDRMQK